MKMNKMINNIELILILDKFLMLIIIYRKCVDKRDNIILHYNWDKFCKLRETHVFNEQISNGLHGLNLQLET